MGAVMVRERTSAGCTSRGSEPGRPLFTTQQNDNSEPSSPFSTNTRSLRTLAKDWFLGGKAASADQPKASLSSSRQSKSVVLYYEYYGTGVTDKNEWMEKEK